MMEVIRECNIGYEILKQEEADFDVGWQPKTSSSSSNSTESWYHYTPASDINGYPYYGKLAIYSGGGYLAPLKGSKDELKTFMKKLENEKWIDRYTRAVFVEFTTYNAQVCM